jgi:Protein of unknown function (DUF4242)
MEMGLYLAERYLPGATGADVASAARRLAAATEQLAAQGIPIRYLGSTFVPADETCFCEFEASSMEPVEWVNERAQVPTARILPAVRLPAGPEGRPE